MSFLTSLALLSLSALLVGAVCRKGKLPPLIGMLIVGIVMGPFALNWISPDVLNISSELRRFALIVILTRAGLSLRTDDLKKVGRPAFLLCFLPASFEIAGYMIFAHLWLGLSLSESAMMGAVMAAVSPAVVVPRMLKLQQEGWGCDRGIPQMITAGASCDDVFVIVLFSALLTMNTTGSFDFGILWRVPVSIVSGIAVGLLAGWLFSLLFRRFRIRDTVKLLILLSVSCLLVALEDKIGKTVPFSGLLAVISLGILFNRREPERAERLAERYGKLWVFAELLLFVLVGAEVDLSYAVSSGLRVIPVVLAALVFRTVGVFVCLAGTGLAFRERLFCAIAYLPKATVQAAIGAIPLSAGLPCGNVILTAAVLAILITAPVGALFMDLTYKTLLKKRE